MMEKKMNVSGILLFCAILLGSCGYSNANNMKLKEPSILDANMNSSEMENAAVDPKVQTIDDLQEAFKGETTASAKYAAYSKKAEEDGYHEIALLFKAASSSEYIHASNHRSVLSQYGVKTPVITPEFTVNSTKENLEDAIKGESYEISTMYPEFLNDANSSKSQLALISFNYAFETEKKHKVMYENALVALGNNSVKSLPTVYYICPTCGNTYDTTPPKRCGISMTSSERFSEISSL